MLSDRLYSPRKGKFNWIEHNHSFENAYKHVEEPMAQGTNELPCAMYRPNGNDTKYFLWQWSNYKRGSMVTVGSFAADGETDLYLADYHEPKFCYLLGNLNDPKWSIGWQESFYEPTKIEKKRRFKSTLKLVALTTFITLVITNIIELF